MSEPVRTIERRTLSRDGFRFELRPHVAGVGEEVYPAAMASGEALASWMPWFTANYCIEEMIEYSNGAIGSWEAGSSYEFVIFDCEDGAAVGACGLNDINWIDLVSNLGYRVSTPKGRLGAATQAVQLLWEFGVGALGLNRMEIVVAEGNAASRGVAQKAGALYEGVQRKRVRIGEKVLDAHMYACLS
jgi:ribosomal-protein-serine acetyltransferase